MAQQAPLSHFEQLPGELQNKIFEFIGYVDGVQLSSVNKYFRNIIGLQTWTLDQKLESLHEAELSPKYNKAVIHNRFGTNKAQIVAVVRDGYACFECFKILDRCCFARNQTERRGAKGCDQNKFIGHKRFCIDCGIRTGKYGPITFFAVVAAQEWHTCTYETLYTKTCKHLTVCPNCLEAHEFIDHTIPQVCKDCKKAHIEFDGSTEALTAFEKRKEGYWVFQCLDCNHMSEVRKWKRHLYCSSCDDKMCHKCGGSQASGCTCGEPLEPVVGMSRLFKLEDDEAIEAEDVFEGAESKLLEVIE